MIIISDTSVITNLAAINHLQLLPQLYKHIIIPTAVYRELADIDPPVPGTKEVQSAQWIEVKSVATPTIVQQLQQDLKLDPGESEAIALALELHADLLLIDERRGRAEANRLGLRITGLLGILVEAKQRQYISAVKPLMDNLVAMAQFRIAPQLYKRILEMVDEI